MNTFHPPLVAVLFLVAVGCGQNVPQRDHSRIDENEQTAVTLGDMLLHGQSLKLPANSQYPSDLTFALAGTLVQEPSMTLPIAGGHVRVHQEDTFWMDALTFFFDDIVVNPRPAFPNGVVMTGIEMSLVAAATADDVVWTEDDQVVTAGGTFDLKFDWSWTPLDDRSEIHPLPTQQIPGFTYELVASTVEDEEGMGIEIHAHSPGLAWLYTFSSDDSSVELHDPALALTAR